MKKPQVDELLYQALETELGGIEVYRAAIECAENDDLKEEWEKYGKQTERHAKVLREVFDELGLDPDKETPGRQIVRDKARSLVAAMETARESGSPEAAQLVAAECVVDAETKDHMNWELIGQIAKKAPPAAKKALQAAYDEVEDEEDEHLYHTKGWARELWLDSLGLPAQLPPPEEERDVKTEMEEARVNQERQGKSESRRSVEAPGRSREKGRRRPSEA
jgi:rubrerythrin